MSPRFKKYASIVLGPLLTGIILFLGRPDGLSQEGFFVLAFSAWIVWWWMVEALPIGITSLLPLLLFPLANVMTVHDTSNYYASPIIFLFIGGFIIALAMEKWMLHKRIALWVIRRIGTNQQQILLGFILATALLSMWISNTATTLMMLPIGISIITQFETVLKTQEGSAHSSTGFSKALVISIAYAASIGGIATLVGTPTNLIFVDFVESNLSEDIAFDKWFYLAFPFSLIMIFILWFHFSKIVFKLSRKKVVGAKKIIREELVRLGPVKYEEKWVMVVFGLVALAWMSRAYVIKPYFPNVTDTSIALVGAIILFVIPARSGKSRMLMDWNQAVKLPWQVILLFGGAFALAGSFQQSGLTYWIGMKLELLQGVPLWVILLVVVAVVNYLTELTQNMATCTLMLPIMAGLSETLDVHPFILMVPMTMAASCAFMLPVATAPNAIVFGSERIQIKDMVRAGFWLNIISVILITGYVYLNRGLF